MNVDVSLGEYRQALQVPPTEPLGVFPPRAKAPPTRVVVSCLMVALPRAERFERFRRAVASYLSQTHASTELVIVLAGGEAAACESIRRHIASLGRDDVRSIDAAPDLRLGALRNRSMEAARGDVLCQWDDDDVHHPQRLARQLAELERGDFEAVYLQDAFTFVTASAALYWTNWAATETRAHPGTLMLRAGLGLRYPETGSDASLGEDLVFARALAARGRTGVLAGEPQLFVYVTHGHNSWGGEHHRMLLERLAISKGLLLRRKAAIVDGVRALDLGAKEIAVCGNNGPAFSVDLR